MYESSLTSTNSRCIVVQWFYFYVYISLYISLWGTIKHSPKMMSFMANYLFRQICVFIDIKHSYTCVYILRHTSECDVIWFYNRWSISPQENIENNSGVQTPLKTKQKSKYATEKMRDDSFFPFTFGRMLCSPYSSSTPWQWSCIDMLSTRLYFWLVFRRILYQNDKDWISARSYMLSVYYQIIFLWSNVYLLSWIIISAQS